VTTLHGRVVLPDGVLSPGVVRVEGDRIAAIGAGSGEPACWIVPGLVDVHVHGGGGGSFPSGDEAGARRAAAYHLAHGTTSLLASLVTAAPGAMLRATSTLAGLCEDGTLAGIHLEGPFLAAARCGAHDPALLRAPDPGLLDRLLDAGRGHVRQVTLAPELPGALDLIARLRDRGVVAAVGHTDASYAEAAAGFAAGAGLATHLFNAMPPLHHRAPGPVAAALTAGATCEVIADGVHLDDATVAMLFATIGAGRIALVTDAMAAAGLGDGTYTLGPRTVEVSGGVARVGSGAIAGGTATMDAALRRVVAAGVSVVEATRAATLTPARALGLDAEVGALAVGARADLCVLDADLVPVAVMRRGRWVYGGAVVSGSAPPGPR
jgi:N-acetylglucosamine-6-phosphate deacetylase